MIAPAKNSVGAHRDAPNPISVGDRVFTRNGTATAEGIFIHADMKGVVKHIEDIWVRVRFDAWYSDVTIPIKDVAALAAGEVGA